MFYEYPYTSYDKINLDWILDLGKKLEADAKNGEFDGERGPGIYGITVIWPDGAGGYANKFDDVKVGDFIIGTGPETGVINPTLFIMKVTSITGNYLTGTRRLRITGPKGDQGVRGVQGERGRQGKPATDAQVSLAVNNWLGANIDTSSGYVLDNTLTMSNAAAPADKVGKLKSDIDSITEDIKGANIFNQADANVVEGKYLNYTNGNEGTGESYSYCADYIPVKPNTQYFGGVWRKSNGEYTGPYGAFVVFYDADKGYLGGLSGSSAQNPFTTPANCAYMRLSFAKVGWTEYKYMFVEGTTAPATYAPYYSEKILKLPFAIVDVNGGGSFTSIATAVDAVESGSTIIVMPGIYEENVKAWGKKINIVGLSKDACILKDTSGNYSTPPLEIGAGSIQNMSIIEEANGNGTESQSAYAIHVESNNLFNEKLLIRDCYIYSDSSSAVGVGLRGGCSVRIEDCEIICAGSRGSTGAAPLYFHDADAQAYWGTANLYLHNNVFRNTSPSLFSMLTINSIHKENTTYLHFMYNIMVRKNTEHSNKFNTWNTSGNTAADGWNGLSHMYLEDDSYGNNLTELNYTA